MTDTGRVDFKPTYDSIIAPALTLFEAEAEQQRFVPLEMFYPDTNNAVDDYRVLVEAEDGLLDFRYVHVGDWAKRMVGAEAEGRVITDVIPTDEAQDALFSYSHVVMQNEPVVEERRLLFRGFIPFRYHRAMLPLSADGQAVTHVMVYVAPGPWWAQKPHDLKQRSGAGES